MSGKGHLSLRPVLPAGPTARPVSADHPLWKTATPEGPAELQLWEPQSINGGWILTDNVAVRNI